MTEQPAFTHPLTYAFEEATEENLARAIDQGFRHADQLKHDRADLLERMRPLRERLAELRGPAVLPPRRHRTAAQDVIASCPRCGGSLGDTAA